MSKKLLFEKKERFALDEKRLLLLCQHFYPEMISTGMHMTELSLALKKLGWEIAVCCAQPSLSVDYGNEAAPVKMDLQGIKIVRVHAMGSHSRSLMARALFGITYILSSAVFVLKNRERYDGLLITTNPPFLGLVGRMASKLLGKPYVMIVYDVYPDIPIRLGFIHSKSLISYVLERMSRYVYRGAAHNVVIGRDMERVIAGKLGLSSQGKICLIPNWSDENVVYPVPKEKNAFRKECCREDLLLVQYSGRMARTHNLEPLIGAAEMLRDDPVCFQFIGDGAKKRMLQELASKRQLTNIQFLPYQPMDRLNEVLSAADLAVVCLGHVFTGLSVPSKTYGVLASATPILAFVDEESEIGRTIIENKCGIVLANPSAGQVAETIRQALRDRGRLKEMGKRGYEAFKSKYTLAIAANRYNALLGRCFYR